MLDAPRGDVLLEGEAIGRVVPPRGVQRGDDEVVLRLLFVHDGYS